MRARARACARRVRPPERVRPPARPCLRPSVSAPACVARVRVPAPARARVLRLARDLKALASALPKPAPVRVNPLRQPEDVVRGEDGEGGDLPPMPLPVRDAEITEPAPERDDDDDDEPGDGELGDGEPGDGEPGDGEPGDGEPGDGSDPTGDAGEPEDSQEPGEGASPQPGMDDTPAGDCDAPREPVTANEGANEMGGRSDHEPKPEPAEDLSDDTQVYAEAHLDDLAAEAARDAGKLPHEVKQEGMHAATASRFVYTLFLSPPPFK